MNERDDNQKRLEMKVDELNDTIKELTEAHQTEMQTKELLNKKVKDLEENLVMEENEKIELQTHLDTRLEELTEDHQTEMQTKEASFNNRAQQWEEERGTFEGELKRIQVEFVQEKERCGIALKKSVNVECDLIKLREIQEDKERGVALKVQRLEAHIEKNEKTVKDVKDELKTASQAIIDLNQRRKADLDELEALKKEKEVEIRKFQTAATRTDELTHEVDRLREDLSKQVKGSTFEAEAPQTESEPEGLRQRFDFELREVTDKINKEWEAKLQSLEHEHKHAIAQLKNENALKSAALTEELGDEKIKLETELETEQRNSQEIQKARTKELEKQANRHKEELIKAQNDHKKTLAESNQKHQKELIAQREQARKLELKYQTELKKERQQRDGRLEETMDQGSPDSSPEQKRREAKVEIEIEQQDQIQQKIADLKQENDFLKTQLTDQQQHARYLQSELDHQTELYGQLQVQVVAKQQLAAVPTTIGDVSYIQTCTCTSFLACFYYIVCTLATVEH